MHGGTDAQLLLGEVRPPAEVFEVLSELVHDRPLFVGVHQARSPQSSLTRTAARVGKTKSPLR